MDRRLGSTTCVVLASSTFSGRPVHFSIGLISSPCNCHPTLPPPCSSFSPLFFDTVFLASLAMLYLAFSISHTSQEQPPMVEALLDGFFAEKKLPGTWWTCLRSAAWRRPAQLSWRLCASSGSTCVPKERLEVAEEAWFTHVRVGKRRKRWDSSQRKWRGPNHSSVLHGWWLLHAHGPRGRGSCNLPKMRGNKQVDGNPWHKQLGCLCKKKPSWEKHSNGPRPKKLPGTPCWCWCVPRHWWCSCALWIASG